MKTKLTKEEQKSKELEASTAKEEMFQLVAKIISWKTKSQDSYSMQNKNKISVTEWQQYKKHLMDISKTDGADKVKEKLKDIYSAIQNNQGFE